MQNFGNETNFSPTFEYTLSGEEAFFGILFTAVTADGRVGEDEINNIWNIVDNMMLFVGIPGEKWKRIVEDLTNILEKKGHDALTRLAARCLPYTLRETAYTNAVDLLFSDGVVNLQEKIFMDKLRDLLNIKPHYAEEVVEVMALRYMNL
ncbi:MAG: tellurite resistance TerB family protein [Bacteroidota bacterium]